MSRIKCYKQVTLRKRAHDEGKIEWACVMMTNNLPKANQWLDRQTNLKINAFFLIEEPMNCSLLEEQAV